KCGRPRICTRQQCPGVRGWTCRICDVEIIGPILSLVSRRHQYDVMSCHRIDGDVTVLGVHIKTKPVWYEWYSRIHRRSRVGWRNREIPPGVTYNPEFRAIAVRWIGMSAPHEHIVLDWIVECYAESTSTY